MLFSLLPARWHQAGRLLLTLAGWLSSPAPVTAQTPAAKAAKVTPAVVLAGHVTKRTAATVTLSYAPDWRGQLTQTLTAPVSPAGDFRLVLPALAAPTEARLGYADDFSSLWLAPGYNLRVSFDPAHLDETIRYTGRGASEDNYLTQSYLTASQDDAAGRTPDARAGQLSAAELRQAADAYRQQRRAELAAYQLVHPLPAAFLRQQQQALDYEWASALLSYYAHQTEQRRQQGFATLPVGYYDFLPGLQLARQDSALGRNSLQGLLLTYGFTQLNDPVGNLPTGPGAGERLYQQASAALGEGRVRDVAVGQYLLTKVESEHADVRPLLPTFRQHNRDSAVARDLRRAVRTHLALMSGQPAPDFALLDAQGKKFALSDLRGQVVYLDFWASWCAPCLAEMPPGAELRRKFAGRPVVFLYVSLDAKAADWQHALATKPLTSPSAVHLRDGAAFDGPAARAFGVQAIPSYWLIGPDGRILSNNPPRPSTSPAIDNALEQALKP